MVYLVLPEFAVSLWCSLDLPFLWCCLVLPGALVPLPWWWCRSPSTCSRCVVRIGRCSTSASVSGVSKCVAGLMVTLRCRLCILA